jgi:hypothetical protein
VTKPSIGVLSDGRASPAVRAAYRRPDYPPPRLSSPLLVLHALALALLAGLGSLYWAVSGDYPLGKVRAGPWTAVPRAGSRDADPYARAIMARSGVIPLAAGEGLSLSASDDDAGRPLDARCAYRVRSVVPAARFWTLTLYDADGRPAASELNRNSFTSAEVMRDAEGGFTIVIGPEAMAGNWLQMPARGRVNLTLRLYDTPVAAGPAPDRRSVPAIERLECLP